MENQPTLSQLLEQAHVTPELYARVQKETASDNGRMIRALSILANKEYKLLPSGLYEFAAHSVKDFAWKVNPKWESCNCPDCENGHLCKHLICFMLLRDSPAPVAPQPARHYNTLDEAIAYFKAQAAVTA